MSRRAGHTLLEMALVVAVLGTIAALVVPNVIDRTDRSRRAQAFADLQTIAEALDLHRLDAGRYPTTEQGLDAVRRYVDAVPLDPWGRPYDYVATGSLSYRLGTFGADGEAGGTGAESDLGMERP